MEFKEDGTYVISSKGNAVPGKFWFEGEEFHIRCPYGHGVYTVQLQKTNNNLITLSFTLIEDEVSARIADLAKGMSQAEP
jgi:hypothetical protein